MGEDTGVFGKISDEAIEAAKGITYTQSKLMADPLAGLQMSATEEAI